MSRQMGFNLESGKYKREAQAWGFALTQCSAGSPVGWGLGMGVSLGGEGRHQNKELEYVSGCPLIAGAAASEHAPSSPPSKEHTLEGKGRDTSRSDLLA